MVCRIKATMCIWEVFKIAREAVIKTERGGAPAKAHITTSLCLEGSIFHFLHSVASLIQTRGPAYILANCLKASTPSWGGSRFYLRQMCFISSKRSASTVALQPQPSKVQTPDPKFQPVSWSNESNLKSQAHCRGPKIVKLGPADTFLARSKNPVSSKYFTNAENT